MADSTSPETLRAQPVARLRARGRITDPVVAAAFARLPRHLFTPPGTSLSAAYEDAIVATKRGPDGKTLSSVSAPWLQAHLLAAAGLRPGARVLEVGSGGYHAALIAELVGDEGRVVGVDIDADVVANARTALARAGYPQVHVSGPAASRLVADILGLLAVWDAQHRAGPGPRITVHRGGSRLPEVEGLRLLVPRRHSLTAITWPGRCR